MKHVVHVVGARPNFMKLGPVEAALRQHGGVEQTIVHTGQHYDENMSEVFFRQLGIPRPDLNLEVGSGTHAWQTAQIMQCFEPAVLDLSPDLVVVYGDVNSTVAASLVCAKLGIAVGHVEAGLRSRDWSMPEEINRVVTDRLAELLFTPSRDGDDNLLAEGVPAERIRFVGNVMIDTLVRLLPQAEERRAAESLGLDGEAFGLVTLHRPSNVDGDGTLKALLAELDQLGRQLPILFPVHPRTRRRIAEAGLSCAHIEMVDPLGYLDFLSLMHDAAVVVTDSGGIQEETTYLQVPCFTVRANTERPVTVELGTNELVGNDMARLRAGVARVLDGDGKKGAVPELWDGHAGRRIGDIIVAR
ncbi:MAG: UDP-N-acetylglucosamine 2-epimerase (non-hydrolyzing) [Acidobacteriota bacterium]|jgi:UDP-N-acetylglucosamine 2-epimerase (non-hydrolysing)